MHLPPALQVLQRDVAGATATGRQLIYSRSAFPVSDKRVQGIHPLDHFGAGAEDSRQASFPDTGSVNRTSSEIIHVKELTSAQNCGASGPITYGKTQRHLDLAH